MKLSERIAQTQGHASGFDYMRLALAVSVVCLHSLRVSYGPHATMIAWDSPLRPFLRLILPMFFALSGFLVAGSLERSRTLGMFLGLRAIRIYPALFVEVVLSAFILGPILTHVALQEYFSSQLFFKYLLNVTGDIHYFLPGVFENNPAPRQVNAQLWTVPYELMCYASIAVLSLLGLRRHRIIAPLGAVGLSVFYFLYCLHKNQDIDQIIVLGPLLVACFLFGVSLYLYRNQIAWSGTLFAAAGLACIALLSFEHLTAFVVPLPIAYLTVFLGLTSPQRTLLIRGADYSYGIFLYGYAIQQTFATLGAWTHVWYINILFCVPLSAAFAALSWNLVEKPALGLRTKLSLLENAYLARTGERTAA